MKKSGFRLISFQKFLLKYFKTQNDIIVLNKDHDHFSESKDQRVSFMEQPLNLDNNEWLSVNYYQIIDTKFDLVGTGNSNLQGIIYLN